MLLDSVPLLVLTFIKEFIRWLMPVNEDVDDANDNAEDDGESSS